MYPPQAAYLFSLRRAQDLETRIAQARSADEGLQLAIEAAELAMRALGVAKVKAEREEMKARASELLRMAEGFKKQISASASAGRQGTGSVPSTSCATPSVVSTRSLGPSATSTMSLSLRTSTAASSVGSVAANAAKPPRSRRELSKAEQILLMRGSKVNGCKFPPWAATPNTHDFFLTEGGTMYT
jgi:hypothetical protein